MQRVLLIYIVLIILLGVGVLLADPNFTWEYGTGYHYYGYLRGIGEVGLIAGLVMSSIYAVLFIQGQGPIKLEQQLFYIVDVILIILTIVGEIIWGVRGAYRAIISVALIVIEILSAVTMVLFLIILFQGAGSLPKN